MTFSQSTADKQAKLVASVKRCKRCNAVTLCDTHQDQLDAFLVQASKLDKLLPFADLARRLSR